MPNFSANDVTVYPLDFMRTRLGVDIGRPGEGQFKGIGDFISKIYKQSGIKGFYAGAGLGLFCTFTYRGMYFGLFDTGKWYINDFQNKSLFVKYMLAQSVTIIANTVNYPLDTVRRRLTLNSGLKERIHTSAWTCARDLYREGGIKVFYKGIASKPLSHSFVLILQLYFNPTIAGSKI